METMNDGIDKIHTPANNGLYELGHGDDLDDYQTVVVTDEAVYGTDEVVDNDYIEEATGEEPLGFYAHGEERGSLKARRATDTELEQALRMTDSPFSVLDGQLQGRDQSTGAVTDEELPVDQSPTAGRYGLRKVMGD